ncbi:aldose 1-epimerase [Methylocystis parvus]|uniref:Aldose 1-epimerase family protein n=1 Tax=Methylocystis parvus TaxID=134 RepID=A0A6B8MAV9_9HYPH|nr:aldose 1-epimerase [Methylocystis parvus]QGM98882.1 aldose 1-epimerase family protein [Methylocystis parvus]WBK00762.1 aldose 1-epimerase family protein [Methylocystis parvus OBBP]
MSDAILLEADGDAAEILPFGAELSAWRTGGVDMIWAKDPVIWDQTAPILFPVVGWTRNAKVTVDGRAYPLALHGFAWKKQFEIAERRKDYLRLVLLDDAETHALYPFAFRFEVEFRLRKGALDNNLIVANTDARPLPYACGLHPAFRWPLAGSSAEHAILFEMAENPDVPVIGPGGLFMKETRHTPLTGARMPLEPSIFARDALCFLNISSRSLAFDNGAGARLKVTLDEFPHVGFWTLPPAPYLCIEPWTGHGDPVDFHGDLYEKPSMRILQPGESARHGASFAFETSPASV